MEGLPLKRQLLLLVAAGMLPVALASGLALLALAEHQRDRAKQAGLEVTRALSTAVDGELKRSVSALEALAASSLLDRDDLQGFHEVLVRALAKRPEWLSIVLHDPGGNMLLNTRLPFGTAMPVTAEPETLQYVLRERRPAVGYLARGALGTFNLAIRVPVERRGGVRYVLSGVIKPDAIRGIVTRQRLPGDWVVSVFDARGSRVARSRQHEEYLAKGPAPSLKVLMAGNAAEGSGITHALEGDRIYTAYTRSPETGWAVAIGIPPSVVDASAMRSLGVYGGGIVASILLGMLAAYLLGRRITVPMAALSAAAEALGRRQRPQPPRTRIPEIRAVSDSLLAASQAHAIIEAEREQLLEREREARAAAEATNRAKDEFLAMLGHELRNPLGAITNASRVLDHPASDADMQRRAKDVVRRQAQHLARLTDDLLDAARAVAGKIVLRPEDLELSTAVERALDTLSGAGSLGRHVIERAFEPAWVRADPTRVEQIALNVMANALKFTPPGGRIVVTVRREGADAVLAVRDTGAGMTPELCARAFDLFVQGERGIDRAQGGLGIGLTLVKRLAELHGGGALARSEGPGRGTEVLVRFPAVDAATAELRAPDAPTTAAGCDVLVIEDNEDGARMLRDMLTLLGQRVRVAYDGPTGLAEALRHPPEVAFIDIGLPGMDGLEVARRIREGLQGRSTRAPLLAALTGYGQPEDRARALAAGFDTHLVKPVDAAALGAVLARVRLAA